MQDFRTLRVWQASHEITQSVYRVTRPFPREERYGLTSQLRRAAVSVPANIAEGCGRFTTRDAAKFFQVAMGSASELQYHLLLARDLSLLSKDIHSDLDRAVGNVKRMRAGLLGRARAHQRSGGSHG